LSRAIRWLAFLQTFKCPTKLSSPEFSGSFCESY
jgi:hypothetical protein